MARRRTTPSLDVSPSMSNLVEAFGSRAEGADISNLNADELALELTVVMPCLNEAATVGQCVARAFDFLVRESVRGEVLVVDNGSTDGSREIAIAAGARVVAATERGYGAALQAGIAAARGRFVVMGDSDASYDLSALTLFVDDLRAGNDLVMGNRFKGGIKQGAMPALHRYLGNPVLSFVGRLLFRSDIGDFHCGLRGFRKAAIDQLDLSSPGMEFASEMVVKAMLAGLRISEVPTTLAPDGRDRPPHLRSWRDGWRHLRFLLTMSPRWLLLYPGLLLIAVGSLLQAGLASGPLMLGSIGLGIHTLLYAATATLLGLQLVLFSVIARAIGLSNGLLPPTRAAMRVLGKFTLERGLIVGLSLAFVGLALAGGSVLMWAATGMSALDPREVMRLAIPASGLILAGCEIVFASFVLSLVGSRQDARRER